MRPPAALALLALLAMLCLSGKRGQIKSLVAAIAPAPAGKKKKEKNRPPPSITLACSLSPASISLSRCNATLTRSLNPPTQTIKYRLPNDSTRCRRVNIIGVVVIHRFSRRRRCSASGSCFGSRRGGHSRRPPLGDPRHESHAREAPGTARKRQAADAARGLADVSLTFPSLFLFPFRLLLAKKKKNRQN